MLVRRIRAACTTSIMFAVMLAMAGEVSTAALAEPLKKLRLSQSFITDGSTGPYHYAKHSGMFQKAGFDATVDPSAGTGDVLMRVASGAYDAGLADIGPLVEFAVRNPDVAPRAVLIVHDTAQYAIMSFKRTGIGSPANLAGKSLGGARGEAAMSLFPVLAKAAGLDLAKVDVKYGDVRLRETMFLRGEYDAVAGFDATMWFNVRSQGVKYDDLNFMTFSDYGLDLYGQSLVVSRDFLRRDPDGVRKVVGVVTEAWIDAVKDHKRVAAALPLSEPLVELGRETERLEWIVKHHVATPRVQKTGLSSVDAKRLQAQIDAVVQAFSLPAKPAIDEIYTAEFLPPLPARMLPQ
jgi:NitT/TauT family transport system substrate-binding protein